MCGGGVVVEDLSSVTGGKVHTQSTVLLSRLLHETQCSECLTTSPGLTQLISPREARELCSLCGSQAQVRFTLEFVFSLYFCSP